MPRPPSSGGPSATGNDATDPGAVEERYGLSGVLGGFSGSLDQAEGVVRLFHPNGGLHLEAENEDRHPWPAAAGAGHTLVLARPSPT